MTDEKIHPYLTNYMFDEIISSYDSLVVRLYCRIRAHILRNRLLREVGQYIPDEGAISELGCGFGLFSNYFALSRPSASFCCCDISDVRIDQARSVATKMQINNVQFCCEDAISFLERLPPQNCIYMLDLMHHLPRDQVKKFLSSLCDHLLPEGTLLIKDVMDKPPLKKAFTWILDVLMTGGSIPNYLSVEEVITHFDRKNLMLTAHCLDDYLPYPHVLYVIRKQKDCSS